MKNKDQRPNLYIIAGPNGAGKTTFARKFLPDYAKCLEFVNADLIASGLSPFAPERVAISGEYCPPPFRQKLAQFSRFL